MDRVLKVSCADKRYEFLTRTEAGYDVTVAAKIVIREIFSQNVYQVGPGDLEDTGVVVDIGGNIGAFDIYCAALGAKSIHTFEPDDLNWGVLLANIRANGLEAVIHPHHLGVSREAGSAELIQGQGASFFLEDRRLTREAKASYPAAVRQAVDTISLASVFADNGIANCDILKIDCEGSEYGIIAGADPEVLMKARYITMEFHSASAVIFGKMIAKLSLTHNLHIVGRHTMGGQIYGRLY